MYILKSLVLIMLLISGKVQTSLFAESNAQKNIEVFKTATSADGSIINYYEHGQNGPILVFVHGWSCDAGYWKEQITYFKDNYHLVLIDLAGHGRSQSKRENYTVEAFGNDVKAVIESIGAEKVILIGHSMGALVIAKTYTLIPDKVIGLIAIDDLQNVEYPLTNEQLNEMITPFHEDFKNGVRGFVTGMLRSDNAQLNEWIISDMSLADPKVALSAINGTLGGYLTGDVAKLFDGLDVPIVAVNSDLWPTDLVANKRHIKNFELIELGGLDHFLMLKAPKLFNPALLKAIKIILKN